MPEYTRTVWTCTRCGCVEEVEGMGQPKNWVRVGFVTPPKASWSDCLTIMGDLCNGPRCGGLLVEFVNGKEKVAEERLNNYDEMMARVEGTHSARSVTADSISDSIEIPRPTSISKEQDN